MDFPSAVLAEASHGGESGYSDWASESPERILEETGEARH